MHTGGQILYLDFDGVLHPDDAYRMKGKGLYLKRTGATHKFFENSEILVEALKPFPDVKIVLATSWVRALKSFTRTKKKLPKELSERVVGSTYHSYMTFDKNIYSAVSYFDQLKRWQQIAGDADRRKPQAWMAIDDDDTGLPDQLKGRFVVPFDDFGIANPVVQEDLINKLNNIFAAKG